MIGMIMSGHVLISCTHTSYSVNKIASTVRCLRSADQNMAAHNLILIATKSTKFIEITTKFWKRLNKSVTCCRQGTYNSD